MDMNKGNVKFPDRIVLAVGFPWATGTGSKIEPYQSVMMLRSRFGIGTDAKRLAFPKVLWARSLPQYRLVLERVRGDK